MMSVCPSSASAQITISRALDGAAQSKLARGLGAGAAGAVCGLLASSAYFCKQAEIFSWQESSIIKRTSNASRTQLRDFCDNGVADRPHLGGMLCSHCFSLWT